MLDAIIIYQKIMRKLARTPAPPHRMLVRTGEAEIIGAITPHFGSLHLSKTADCLFPFAIEGLNGDETRVQ